MQTFTRYRAILCILGAFALPLKLILAYFFLIPALALWYIGLIRGERIRISHFSGTLLPLLLFALSALLSAPFGIDPLRSIEKIVGFSLLAASIPLYYEAAATFGTVRLICALLAGQSIASLHSVLSASLPGVLPPMFLGQVTESGQLALTVVVALGLVAFISIRKCSSPPTQTPTADNRPLLCVSHSPLGYLLGCVNFLLICCVSFSEQFGVGGSARIPILVLTILMLACAAVPAILKLIKDPTNSAAILRLILGAALPLLCGALLVNLKRGPWAGVITGSLILVILYGRKYILTLLLIAIAFSFSLPPVHQRLADSMNDFFISGGRSQIWEIGGELITRYPLGIGYKNSSFLRNFSLEIPPQLTHFHNNLINISVETGWISFVVFLWWLYLLLKTSFSKLRDAPESILRAAIGCAIVSWQVAGLVEYNFGDSEVWLMVLLLTGLLAFSSRPVSET